MELQNHLRRCIITGRQMKLIVQCLSEDQIFAETQPHSDDSQRPNCHGEHLKSAEFLHPTLIPDNIKCTFKNCSLIFPSSQDMKEHKETHCQATKFQCDVCGKLISSKKYLPQHMNRHTHLRIFDCDVPGCSYLGMLYTDLQNHKKKVHTSILFTCLLCGKNIKMFENYKLHMAKHDTSDPPGIITCLYPKCKEVLKSAAHLRKHNKESHKDLKMFQCNDCDKCFPLKKTLARHVMVHWDWRPFKCDIPGCSYSAKVARHLQRHKDQMHTLDLFKCISHCGQTFKNRVSFKQHFEKHKTGGPGILKCPHIGCEETFTVLSDLKTHIRQHKLNKCDVPGCLFMSKVKLDLCVHRKKVHSIWSHNCQLCGKGFDKSSHLVRHVQFHETGEPGVIKCAKKHCKQTFTSIADFKKHLVNHENLFVQQNEFECQLCGKIIKSNRTNFERHVLNHETDTPGVLKCTYWKCKLTFTSATDLKQHYLGHWDVSLRPFACDFPQCNFAGTHKRSLYIHKRQVHSSNLYTCDMCGKQFKNLSSIAPHFMRRHLKQLSAEKPNPTDKRPTTAEKQQELICKDEIEEVVFD
jgi:KRAB domain-containing zinc finger protein